MKMWNTALAISMVAAMAAAPALAQDKTLNMIVIEGGDTTVLENIVVNGGSGGVITADGYVGKSSATGAKTDTPFTQAPQSTHATGSM